MKFNQAFEKSMNKLITKGKKKILRVDQGFRGAEKAITNTSEVI